MSKFFARIFALVLSALLALSATAEEPAGPALLVLNKSESTMAIIDPATLQVVARVPTGDAPHEVATSADGRYAFVANYGTGPNPGNTLSVIDIAARKEVRRVDLGALLRPHGITERGGKIYFTAEGSAAVARYDPAAGRVDWIIGTGQIATHMLVVTPDAKKIYTANIGSDTVTVIQPGAVAGTAKIAQIAVGQGPEGIDLSPDGRELWVAHRNDGKLSIIDTATDKIKEVITAGRFPIRVKFTPDGRRVLVSNAQGNEVAVFDAATRKEVKRIPVGAVPVGILITPDGRRAFVAATQANKVSVINLEDLTLTGSIEPGREPDGMAWAGK
ncbi:MAG TPA: beta-propeller fold lactonase family protein [Blastocatellia bacterium]|nr:beta-propeller fold lactonase family protein [Blastocatellia bacterium]